MNGASVLERNLLALSASEPRLGAMIGSVRPAQGLVFIPTVKGLPVPARSGGKRPIPFHSTVDPIKEGERFSRLHQEAGYLVFLGLGGGYHVAPFLERQTVARLVVIERDPGLVRAVMERIDLRALLLDGRVRMQVGRQAEELKAFLLSDYLPAIHGDLRVLPLRASIEEHEGYYRGIIEALQEVIGRIADDYTVQVKFGKKWFVNTLANLEAAERSTLAVRPVRRVIVTGAGPSLETQLGQLASLREKAFLIATDTSLPALLDFGFKPDLVISIDCQQVSYHHFFQGIPEDVPLVLDLASPPVLTRLAARTLFFASAHPFSLYVSARWRRFPFIDTSGGNVSHAAVSLARFLGAREIYLLGIDFSYPEGKMYSRGTYIYPYFRARESRLRPLETLFISFLFENRTVYKEKAGNCLRYTTRPMIAYKQRLEEYLKDAAARIIAVPGKGVPLNLPKTAAAGSPGRILAAGAPQTDWRGFLSKYLQGLKSLPAPCPPVSRYLLELSEENRALWVTLFPAAAALRENLPVPRSEGHRLLSRARDWSVSVITRHLDR